MLVPFGRGAYQGRTINISTEKCVNWYIHFNPPNSVNEYSLIGTPGLNRLSTPQTGEVRGAITFGDFMYVVVADGFYEIDAAGGFTKRGTINTSTGIVSMAKNPTQIMMVDGFQGWIYTQSTNTLTQIVDTDFQNGTQKVLFLDSYFIYVDKNTQDFNISSPNDGLTWDGLDFGRANQYSDNLITAEKSKGLLWLIGSRSFEIWRNNGGPDFPYSRAGGSTRQIGIDAINSLVEIDDSLFWLGRNEQGKNVVIRTEGFDPKIKSTRALEFQISQYATTSDAIAYGYQQEGHTFYVLNFPSADATWVFDIASDQWHERVSENGGTWGRHRGQVHTVFNGKNYAGDFGNGKIYELDLNVFTDDGGVIRRRATTPPLQDEQKRIFYKRLQMLFEAGTGSVAGQGSDPQIALDWSNDGGHTWSSEHFLSVGKIGEFERRAIKRRLGYARNRSFGITVTDPVKANLISSYADVRMGVN